ncbi:MAG TPA: glycosyltransferase family 1 protein, partial [Herpetosiphonaceae bacterium]
IGRYALELLDGLAATAPSAAPGAEIVLLSSERADPRGLWRRFETHHLRGCHLLPALMTAGNLALRRAARRLKLDVIHDPNGIAPFAAAHPATRHLVTIHDAFAFVYPEQQAALDTWRYRLMLPRVLRRADRVLTDSAHSRRDLLRYLPLKQELVEVVHCGINERFRPAGPAAIDAVLRRYGLEQPFVLYVGSINGRKNIARLFEAFALVRERLPGLKLVMGGAKQWQTAELEATYDRLDLAADVVWTGYLADEDLPALYSAARAFVFPSLYEGFGLPPLEAMACGTPVVTSDTSSLPEVAGDAALLIDPLDPRALAAAIARICGDEELRAELRARGLAQAARFHWHRAAEAVWGAYQRALAPAGAAGE